MPAPPRSPPHSPVVVIGGGPAGMMAAIRAAHVVGSRGHGTVTLLEQNSILGRKLLTTGGGRCNVTNAQGDRHTLVAMYGERAQGLHSLFARFSGADMRAWLAERGVATKEEDLGRIFPVTDRAQTIRDALADELGRLGVTVRTGVRVTRLDTRQPDAGPAEGAPGEQAPHERAPGAPTDGAIAIETSAGPLTADAIIVATGGLSHPETGSTGDGFAWLQELGVPVATPEPSLVPIAVRESWPRDLQGLALPAVRVSLLLDGVRQEARTGKVLFTHFGMSGPLILNMAQSIADHARYGVVTLHLDLLPDEDGGALDRRLQELFAASPRRTVRRILPALLPGRLITPVLSRAAAAVGSPAPPSPLGSPAPPSPPGSPAPPSPPDSDAADRIAQVRGTEVPKATRKAIGAAMKALPVTFAHLLGRDRAVVSSGGVATDAIDFRTMSVKTHPRIFVVGDLIDVNRQSGGYSLQLCWASGWVAGEAAAAGIRPGSV